jgi:hypothetical protein
MPSSKAPTKGADDARRYPTLEDELMRLRACRDASRTAREWAEWTVAMEEAQGGRPPTRAYDPELDG